MPICRPSSTRCRNRDGRRGAARVVRACPALDLPPPETAVSAVAMRTEAPRAVFFTFHADVALPPHGHGAQWGAVPAGAVALTRDGAERVFRPGDSCTIGAGVVHSAGVAAGSIALDMFEDADRYALRGSAGGG